MDQVNLQDVVSKRPLLDEQAWALCFKSVKLIQNMDTSLINSSGEHGESVFSNLTLGSVELLEDGEISIDLRPPRNRPNAAEENQKAAVKPGTVIYPSTRVAASVVDNTGTGDLPSPPKFRSKFDRLRYEAAEARKKREAAARKVVYPRGLLRRPAYLKWTGGSTSAIFMDGAMTPFPPPRVAASVVDNTGTPSPPIRFRSKFERLRYEAAQAEKGVEKEPEPVVGKDEGEAVLALGRMVRQSMKTTPEGDLKLYDLLARMTGDITKRPSVQRIAKECEIHARCDVDEGYTCVLRDLVCYYKFGHEELLKVYKSMKPLNVDLSCKAVDENSISDDSSADGEESDESDEEDLPTPPAELLNDTNEERGSTPADLQDTNKDDTTMTNLLGGFDAEENNIPPAPVKIKSEELNTVSKKGQDDDDNGMHSQEELSKENGTDLCGDGEDTPKMQDTTIADTKAGKMAAKLTGNGDDLQNVKQEELDQQDSVTVCEFNNTSDKSSLIVNWGNVPEAWCANLTVQQMKKKMGIDHDQVNVPKRNWTKTTTKGKTENTKVEPTKIIPVNSTAYAETNVDINQAEEKTDAEPTDGIVIPPISVNWGDVPEPWSAKLTLQQVKAKMGIKEENLVRQKKILEKKTETIMGESSEEVDEPDGNSEQQCQEESAAVIINWGNVPEKWEANLSVQQVKARMGIKEKRVVSPRRMSDQKKEPEEHQEDERQDEKTVIPPITVKWGNEPEKWAAQLNVAQIKKRMGIKEEKVMRPSNKTASVEGLASNLNSNQENERQELKTVEKVKNSEKEEAVEMQTTPTIGKQTMEVKYSDMDEALETTTEAGDEAKNVKDSERVEEIVIDATTTTGTKTDEEKESNEDGPIEAETNATTEQGFEKVKDSNNMDAAELATTMTSCEDVQKINSRPSSETKMVPIVSDLPARGERLSKRRIEGIKAHLLMKPSVPKPASRSKAPLLMKPSVPKPASRKTKKAVKKISPSQLRTECELQQQLTALNQPKDAGFLKSMLNKVGTYLNPFQWTKAKAKPAVDSSLNAEGVQSDLTSKKGWLPAGVSKVLLHTVDVSVYAALGCCGFYNVLSVERVFHAALAYSSLREKPTLQNVAIVASASQAFVFYFPIGKRYFYPK